MVGEGVGEAGTSGNLPAQTTSVVGRKEEIAQGLRALADGRLVTLTGDGGVGKTRLAVELGAAALERFGDGAWFVELGPLRDQDGVANACATVLGVPAAGASGLESLAAFLQGKELLLVLDNCERLLGPVAELVAALGRTCPGVTVLATSREVLGVDGERTMALRGLPTPAEGADDAAVAASESFRLFVERAAGAGARFSLDPASTAAVGAICRLLDGLPLAIELAAARVTTMTPQELAAGLAGRFDPPAGEGGPVVERPKILRAALDWSFGLLSPAEQRLLARLAVFAGGCTLVGAEAVCAGGPVPEGEVRGALSGLVGAWLVDARGDGAATRYRLTETIRAYAEKRLAETEETVVRRGRHAAYMLEVGADLFRRFGAPDKAGAKALLAAERDNFAAAMAYAVEAGDSDLAISLMTSAGPAAPYGAVRFTVAPLHMLGAEEHPLYPQALVIAGRDAAMRAEVTLAGSLIERAVATAADRPPDPLFRYGLMIARGAMAFATGDNPTAARSYEEAAREAERHGLFALAAEDFAFAALFHVLAGDLAAAEPLASEGLALARRHGAPAAAAASLTALAGSLAERDPDRARACFREGARASAALGVSHAPGQAVWVGARLGEWESVLSLMPAPLRYVHWTGDRVLVAGLLNVAATALAPSSPEDACRLFGMARASIAGAAHAGSVRAIRLPANTSDGAEQGDFLSDLRRTTIHHLRTVLGRARSDELMAEGEEVPFDQVARVALAAIARAQATDGDQA